MKEKEIKYMGNTIKYKEVEIPNRTDDYRRPLTIKVAKQSDAEQVTDEDLAHDIGHVASLWICRLTHISRMRSMLT